MMAALIVLPLSSLAGTSAFVDGGRLYEMCSQGHVQCTAYVDGVVDSLKAMGATQYGICFPEKLTGRQAILAFQRFTTNHPVMLHNSAADLVIEGMAEAFPCRHNSN